MEYRDKDFRGQEVLLDGNVFTGCTFRECRVKYQATAPYRLTACSFKENIHWVLGGHAADTIKFLTQLYHAEGEGGRKLIEQMFEQIRRG